MTVIASWCYRHRLVVIVAWLGVLAALAGMSRVVSTAYDNSYTLPGSDSAQAEALLQRAIPAQAGDADTIVWKASVGGVRDPGVQSRISAMLAQVARAPEVAGVTSPYATAGAGVAGISADGHIAFATVNFTRQHGDLAKADVSRVMALAQSARAPGLEVELNGPAISDTEQEPLSGASAIAIAAAAIILFLAFGSLLAMVLPILTAIAGVVSGLMLIAPLSHVVMMVNFAPILGALIGLGVGIDYALFIVTRYRRGLASGLTPARALPPAAATSGRAVVFAGGTVCVALLGILTLGVGFLDALALAAAVTVVCTVISAITLLPALLGLFGTRVLSRRQRARLRAGDIQRLIEDPELGGARAAPSAAARARGWARWALFVQRRPAALAALAAIVMITLAAPVLHLRLGVSDSGNDPATTTTRKAYDLLADGFGPGFSGPLFVVCDVFGGGTASEVALARLNAALRAEPGVASVVAQPPHNGVALTTVTPASTPEAKETSQLVSRLRGEVIPRYDRGSGLTVHIDGVTPKFDDFAALTGDKLPAFLGAIIGVSFLLLVIAFRSLVIPAIGAVMNLLAAAASYGVLTAFFEWGWGTSAFDLGKAGPIEAFLPVVTLAILFGLSMDYQVFLVSRIAEEWSGTRDNARAVRAGQAETGRVITAAASIMIAVFAAFVLMSQREVAEFGVGLAAAVALDAFVLRTVLVPAAMHLAGTANWWLPRWLDRRLPRLVIEAPSEPDPRVTAPTPAVLPGLGQDGWPPRGDIRPLRDLADGMLR